jgi:hypothetical protein
MGAGAREPRSYSPLLTEREQRQLIRAPNPDVLGRRGFSVFVAVCLAGVVAEQERGQCEPDDG